MAQVSSPARSLLNDRNAFTDILSRAASGAGPSTGDGSSTGGRPPRGGSTDDLRGQAVAQGGAVVHSSGRSASSSRPPPPPRSPPGGGPVARFTGDGSSSSSSVFGRLEEALRLATNAEAALQAHPPEASRRDGSAAHQALDAANQRAQAAQSRVAVERQERERLAASLAQCQGELRAAQAEVARLQREQLAAPARRRGGGGGEEEDGDVEATIGSLLEMLASEQALRSDLGARLAQQQQQLDGARADGAVAAAAQASSEQLQRLQAAEEHRSRAVSDALALLAELRSSLAACLADLDGGPGGATPRTPPGADSATALAGKQRFVLWLAAERKKREEAERRLDDATEELARSEHSRREATQRWLEVASQLSTVAAVAPDVAAAAVVATESGGGGGAGAMHPPFSFASTVRALTPPHALGALPNGGMHGDEDGDVAVGTGAGMFAADMRHRDRGRPRGRDSPDGSIASGRSAGHTHDMRGRAPGTAAWRPSAAAGGPGLRALATGAPLPLGTALQAAAAVVPDLLRRVVGGTMPHRAALEAAHGAAQEGHVAGEHVQGVASAALVLAALPCLWLAAWLLHALAGGAVGDALYTHGLLGGEGGGPHRAGGGAAAAWGLVTGALSLLLRILRWIVQL